MKFYVTRWRYSLGYIAVFMLALLATWSHDRAYDAISWFATIVALLLLICLELLIRSAQLTVGKNAYYAEGIFKKKAYLIHSRIRIEQSKLQRLLRLCNVYFSIDGRKVEMRDVSDSVKLIRKLKHVA